MIRRIAGRVWPGGVDTIEPLGGGITNRNFKIRVGAETFVLRIGGADTEQLGIDRAVERDASVAAAALGIGPEVVAFVEPEGYLVTRYVEGEVGRASVEEVAGLLRRFHGSRPISGRFDSFRVVETYAATARDYGVSLPAEYDGARETAARIEARFIVESRFSGVHGIATPNSPRGSAARSRPAGGASSATRRPSATRRTGKMPVTAPRFIAGWRAPRR